MNKFRARPKKCRACHEVFKPTRPLQQACGITCAIALGKANQQKAAEKRQQEANAKERAEHRAAKERIKSLADHKKDTQQAFNAWVRERDHDEPCISCGRHHNGQYHAGHYRTVGGNPELRFEPMNCHKQCAPCNNHQSGNVIEYRKGLVQKIGEDQVNWLEGKHEAKHYTVDELKALTRHYRAELRALVKAREGRA